MSEEEEVKAEPEYIDPWSPEQRALIDEIATFDEATICDKVSTYPTIIVPAKKYSDFMQNLLTTHKFDMLKSHTCVDWIDEGEFELISLFFSTNNLQHVWTSTRITRENPIINTISKIWPIAEFQEREVYDLFGVQYGGHSDLRRIFLDDDWDGFPLRKDYKDEFMLEKP